MIPEKAVRKIARMHQRTMDDGVPAPGEIRHALVPIKRSGKKKERVPLIKYATIANTDDRDALDYWQEKAMGGDCSVAWGIYVERWKWKGSSDRLCIIDIDNVKLVRKVRKRLDRMGVVCGWVPSMSEGKYHVYVRVSSLSSVWSSNSIAGKGVEWKVGKHLEMIPPGRESDAYRALSMLGKSNASTLMAIKTSLGKWVTFKRKKNNDNVDIGASAPGSKIASAAVLNAWTDKTVSEIQSLQSSTDGSSGNIHIELPRILWTHYRRQGMIGMSRVRNALQMVTGERWERKYLQQYNDIVKKASTTIVPGTC